MINPARKKPNARAKARGAKAEKPKRIKTLPPTPAPTQELVPKPPYVGRLATVADWHRQVGRIYREMRKGLLPTEIGTRLTYVARTGSELAKFVTEAEELRDLKAQLAAIQGRDAPGALAFDRDPSESVLEATVGDLAERPGPEGDV